MKWPLIKGSYRLLNNDGDTVIVTRASFNLQDSREFDECKRIAIIGSCVTENVGIDRMIKNIITNGKLRNIVICGEESKGHNVGNALINLINKGVDNNNRIIDATGDDPTLKINHELINRFRKQITNIKLINSDNPDEIINLVKSLPETEPLSDYEIVINKETIDYSKAINADNDNIPWDKDKGMFRISVMNNKIVVKHFLNNEEHAMIIGTKANNIYKKIISMGLIGNLQHAAWLGSELRNAENCLVSNKDYIEDTNEEPIKGVSLIIANNLADAWIKSLSHVYHHGISYEVGKYNAKTIDMPLIIHVSNVTNKPLMHELSPKYEVRDKYTNEFINGKGKEKENEFVYTYYSRLMHYNECINRSKAKNIMSDDELREYDKEELIQFNQVRAAINLLKRDPTLRRVVMSTWMPYKDLSLERSPHAPCLVMIQPRIINNKLNFYVVFKSQDLYGAFPSNAYAIMRLQELMAKELGVKAGSYTHFTISMHIYDSVIDSVEEVLRKENKI